MIPVPKISQLQPLSLPNAFIPGFDISWAGEGPWNQGLCLGSEDGRICFVGYDLLLKSEPYPAVESGEPINGIAFSENWMVVSTCSETVMWRFPESDDGKAWRSVPYEGGAHDTQTTATGGFIAPLGINGLLAIEKRDGELWRSRIIKPEGKSLYFYKAINLGSQNHTNIHACAVRHDGLAVSMNQWDSGSVSLRTFQGSDIIDVCAISSAAHPFAVVALGIDNSLHFIRDVLKEQVPQTLRFDHLRGNAYRILVAQGNLILLTSECLYIIRHLASRFLNDQPIDVPTRVTEIKIEAVEASIAFGRWLLIVMPDGLLSIDTERLIEGNEAEETREMTPQVHFGSEGVLQFDLAIAAVV